MTDKALPFNIPSSWQVCKIKHVASLRSGEAITTEAIEPEGDFPVYGGNGLRGFSASYTHEGQFVLIGRQGALCGNINYASGKFWASEHAVVVTPKRELGVRWFGELLRSMNLNQYSLSAAQPGLAVERIRELSIPFPPLAEQQRLADFLEKETLRTDSLIQKKERQIALLQEKRQAIITRAVTKGLDPNAKMKDSGVEWIGEMPQDWTVRRLKYLCRIQTGDKDTVEAEPDGEYPFFVRSQTVERISSFAYDCEAVLTAGDGVGVGKVFHYYKGRFDFHQRVYMLNDFRDVLGKFFFYFLRENFFKVALDGGAKSTVDSLRLHVFQNFWIALPPIERQQEIVYYIDQIESTLIDLKNKIETSLALLREYRSSLITAAVSGQIDVSTLSNGAGSNAPL